VRWLAERVGAGLRARWGAASLLAVLAAVVAMVATTTPILLRAVEQAELDHVLSSLSAVDRSVVGVVSSGTQLSAADAGDSAARVPRSVGTATIWTPTRTFREENDDPLTLLSPKVGTGQPKMRLAAVASCTDLRFTAGRCPDAHGQVAMADSTARRSHLVVGQRIELASASTTITASIAGLYDPTTAAGRIAAAPAQLAGNPAGQVGPDLLLPAEQFDAEQVPTTAYSFRALRKHVPLSALPAIRAGIAEAEEVPTSRAGAQAGTRALVPLAAALDRVDQQNAVVAVILEVVAVGAFGLALLAFGAVAQRLSRVRAAEWALPRLRGLPRHRRLGARLVEPLLAVVVGTVIGAAGAVAVAVRVVDPTTRTSVTSAVPGALALAAVAALGSVLLLLWVSVLADRRPLDEQLRRATEPRQLSRTALIASAVVVVAALAAVAALLAEPGTDIEGAGLLAPTLIALGVGLIALQGALAVLRRRTRVVPGSLLGLLVWRRLGRAPSQLIPTVLVASAIALATFVAATSGTARVDADGTAAASVAAPVVLHVRTPRGLSVLAAVERADPTGRRALAAEQLEDGVGVQRVLAVDTARLEAVSTWRSEWAGLGAAALRDRLAPPVVPSLRLIGSRLTVTLDDLRDVTGIGDPDAAFELDAAVQSDRFLDRVRLGPFHRSGSRTLTAAMPCSRGCALVSLTVRNADAQPEPWTMHMRVTAMATDRQPTAVFAGVLRRTGSWIPEIGQDFDFTLPRTAQPHPGADGLAIDLADSLGGGRPGVRLRDTVEPLPALLGATTRPAAFPGSPGVIEGTAVDTSPLLLRTVGTASDLPRLLGDGVLVDLRRTLPQIDQSDTTPDQQVWIRSGTATVERRLRDAGVTILSTETLPRAVEDQRAEAAPTAARYSFIGALGGCLVVLLALVGGRLLAAPDRRRQWGSFAAAGVPIRRLRRLVTVEFLAPGAAAVVLGALSGAAAFVLALPHLPLTDLPPNGPPAGLLIPWGEVLLVPAVSLLLLGLAALVVARIETAGERGAA
jgi:putative ABC transport system permease protein